MTKQTQTHLQDLLNQHVFSEGLKACETLFVAHNFVLERGLDINEVEIKQIWSALNTPNESLEAICGSEIDEALLKDISGGTHTPIRICIEWKYVNGIKLCKAWSSV